MFFSFTYYYIIIFGCVSNGGTKRWNQSNLLVISLNKHKSTEKKSRLFRWIRYFFGLGSPTTLAMKFTAKPLMVIEL